MIARTLKTIIPLTIKILHTTLKFKNIFGNARIANTPMENVCTNVEWKEDQAYLKISGDAREGYLFGPNLLLHKEITIPVGENIIEMHDTIENKGFEKSPLMILYHFNYGYPFLTENAQIYTNYDKVTARDEKSD